MNYTFPGLGQFGFGQFFTIEFVGAELLMPAEKPVIEHASMKRQRDFSTGRYCARKALENIAVGQVEILMGQCREPIWPEGIVGSISHSKLLTGAIVAKGGGITAVGLDIESIGGVSADMWDMLFKPDEQTYLNKLGHQDRELFATLLFSFKEAFYKLQYPLSKQYLDFKEVEISCVDGQFKLQVDIPSVRNLIPAEAVNFCWDKFNNEVICICYLTA